MTTRSQQPLILAFEAEREGGPGSLSPTNSERRKAWKSIDTSSQSAFNSYKYTFHQVWKAPKTMKWRKDAPALLVVIWIFCLITLIIFLALIPRGVLGINEQEPCQPDGEFSLIANSFKWWAYGGFFEITMRMGRFSFTTAKVIDVTWDLVVGRGGQVIMSFATWKVFSEYLQISITAKPATYTMVWLLRFHQEPSAMSTLQLASHFYKRGLMSRTASILIIGTILFILGFPTFTSSMTGYTPFQAAYINSTEGSLIGFSEVFPLAYIIHDGNRTEGLTAEYHVPWKEGAGGQMLTKDSSPGISYDVCDNSTRDHEDCSLQRDISEYIYRYGFGHAINKTQKQTRFRGETINGPPLNISAMYLPDQPFYWNLTKAYAYQYGSMVNSTENPYSDSNKLTFMLGNTLYNYTELRDSGFCQPVRKKGSIQEYQWGFSFLQLFAMTISIFLWSVGLLTLWWKVRLTLVLNQRQAAPGGWKSLLEFTAAINRELEKAGVDQSSLSDKELEDEIQTLLQGGSILSKPLPAGFGSVSRTVTSAICEGAKDIWFEMRNRYFFRATMLVMAIVLVGVTVVNVIQGINTEYRE